MISERTLKCSLYTPCSIYFRRVTYIYIRHDEHPVNINMKMFLAYILLAVITSKYVHLTSLGPVPSCALSLHVVHNGSTSET